MSRDKSAVESFIKGLTSEISIGADKPSPNIWRQKAFRADNAHAKLLAIILAHHKPIDLLTGQKIDIAKSLAWTNLKEYHHFFPRDYLTIHGVDASKANSLANIVMLTSVSNKQVSNRAPSDYLRDVQSASGNALDKWLESNLISKDAFQASLNDDYDGFLAARCETIDSIVADLTGW